MTITMINTAGQIKRHHNVKSFDCEEGDYLEIIDEADDVRIYDMRSWFILSREAS